MRKAVAFIDYDFLCEYEDVHPGEDENAAFIDIANSFLDGKELVLDECGEDYFILDSCISESAARKIIAERFRKTLGVESLEGILKGVEFWPKERDAHILDVSEELLFNGFSEPYKATEGKNNRYIIECFFNTNFFEDYEEDFNMLWQEGICMPARQMAKELERLDGVQVLEGGTGGIKVLCERNVKEVAEFIEQRMAALAGSDDLWGIGFLTVHEDE